MKHQPWAKHPTCSAALRLTGTENPWSYLTCFIGIPESQSDQHFPVTWPYFNTTTATKKETIQTELAYPLTIEMVIVLEECMNLSHNWSAFPMTFELNDGITMLIAT